MYKVQYSRNALYPLLSSPLLDGSHIHSPHPFLILVLRTFCGPDLRKNMNIKRKVELGGD